MVKIIMAIVYKHINKDTKEIFYIGIGLKDSRAYSKHSRGKFWKDYTSKYEYEIEITHTDIVWEEACSIEKYLISFYGRRDLSLGTLVNQTNGGDGNNGIIQTKESNKKRSDKLIGKPKPEGFNIGRQHSKKTIDKISYSHIGMKKPWVKWSKDQIEKRAITRRVMTKEQFENMINLKNNGISLIEISNKLELSYGIIKKWHNRSWDL